MLIKLINAELTNQLKSLFEAQLESHIEILYFFNSDTCDTCDETEQLLNEIAHLTKKIHVSKYDTNHHPAIAQKYNIQHTPSLVIAGGGENEPHDYGIRFSGLPSGYEFSSLIQGILMVSKRDSGLPPSLRTQLKELNKPVHLQVFVTPT